MSTDSSIPIVDHWIDGHAVRGEGDAIPVINPATGNTLATLPEASLAQVNVAVSAARSSFDDGIWRYADHATRQQCLRRIAEAIKDDRATLLQLQMAEGGMTRTSIERQIAASADWFDYYASFLTQEHGQLFRQLPATTTMVEREAIGVCALFSPWNVPLALSAVKLAPALAAGNSMVLKPSELTPMVTHRLVQIIHEAGLPAGVLNAVNGRGAITGAALAESSDIDMISFTGGATAGQSIASCAARRQVPCIMELGGKSATIVFDDADIQTALNGALAAIYGGNGEACLAGSRILLHESIAPHFLEQFEQRAAAMIVGNPEQPDCQMGPMITQAHKAHVLGFYESAIADGDTVLFGGTTHSAASGSSSGAFVDPGAVLISSSNSRLWREEVFGPLAAIRTFDTEAQAISLANDSDYGLAGYVFTTDIDKALRVSKRLRTGSVMINSAFKREQNAPFGGYKRSGIGREGGIHSWYNFTEAKTTVISHT